MIYITQIDNNILPKGARDKKVLHTVFTQITESTTSQTNPTTFLSVVPGKDLICQSQPNKIADFQWHNSRPYQSK